MTGIDRRLFAIGSLMFLTGCAYQVEAIGLESVAVVTSFSNKAPGKWLLFIDAEKLDTTIRSSSVACSAHTFPVELSKDFRQSVFGTLSNVFDSIELVDGPKTSDQMKSSGARGIVTVRAESINGDLDIQQGFFTVNMRTNVSLMASVTVDAWSGGRLFGQTYEGTGRADSEPGMACEGGVKSLKKSLGQAMKDLLRSIGEGVGNSERVRTGRVA